MILVYLFLVNWVFLIKVIVLGLVFFIRIWLFILNKLSKFDLVELVVVWFFGVWEVLLCFLIIFCDKFVFEDDLWRVELEFFFLYCSFDCEFFFEGSFGCVICLLVIEFWGLIKCLWFLFSLLLLFVCSFFFIGLFGVWFSLEFKGLVFGCIVDVVVWEEVVIVLCGLIEEEDWLVILILLFCIGFIILLGVFKCEIFEGIWFIL